MSVLMKLLNALMSCVGVAVGVILFTPFVLIAVAVGFGSCVAGKFRNRP